MKLTKFLLPSIALTSLSLPAVSMTACKETKHLSYIGRDRFEIVHRSEVYINLQLDTKFDTEKDKIQLISQYDNFFAYTLCVRDKILTVHLTQIKKLNAYNLDLNLEIKVITSNWTESIKDLHFNYSIEREKALRADVVAPSNVTTNVRFDLTEGAILQYKIDDDWIDAADGNTIKLSKNKPLYIKGKNPNGLNGCKITFTSTDNIPSVELYGNVYGLLNDEGAIPETLPKSCFNGLFEGSSAIKTVSDNFLLSTNISESCYSNMFKYCINLLNVPKLPASVLAKSCYENMFLGCTSLTTTTTLPALSLTPNCYSSMFMKCSGLKQVLPISATRLDAFSCESMFNGCINLTVKECAVDDPNKFFTCPEYDPETIESPVDVMFSGTIGDLLTPEVNKSYGWHI